MFTMFSPIFNLRKVSYLKNLYFLERLTVFFKAKRFLFLTKNSKWVMFKLVSEFSRYQNQNSDTRACILI